MTMAGALEETASPRRAEGTQRRCIVSREVRPKGDLLRFVVSPAGEVVPDIDARLPGRGLWMRCERDIFLRASKGGALARASRRRVRMAEDLEAIIESQLARRMVDGVAMARRAGGAVAGFERVRGVIGGLRGALGTARGAPLLLTACDAPAPDAGKLVEAVARLAAGAGETRVWRVAVLRAAELGRAFGRERTVHAWIGPGRVAERILGDAKRLAGFRDGTTLGPIGTPGGAEREGVKVQR